MPLPKKGSLRPGVTAAPKSSSAKSATKPVSTGTRVAHQPNMYSAVQPRLRRK